MTQKSARTVTREEFNKAVEVVWEELQYQDYLDRRTEDEAKDLSGFLTLIRVYTRQAEEAWAMNAGPEQGLHGLRKVAGIALRAMVYCGVVRRYSEDLMLGAMVAAVARFGGEDGVFNIAGMQTELEIRLNSRPVTPEVVKLLLANRPDVVQCSPGDAHYRLL